MKILTVQFDCEAQKVYAPLLDVFRRSCARHMPDVGFEALAVAAPVIKAGVHRALSTNTAKLNLWAKAAAQSDEPLLLADCDMLCLRDLRDVWDLDFDVAYTVRSSACRLPFNSGVVFVKPTEAARRFIAEWRDVNERMFKDIRLHTPYRNKYCGMNQAAFGYLLEHPADSQLKLIPLPCSEWNACNEDWERLDMPVTRLVHFKGKLRTHALAPVMVSASDPLYSLVKEWKSYVVG